MREVHACTLLVVRQAWALRGTPPQQGLARTATLSRLRSSRSRGQAFGADIERLIDVLEELGTERPQGG